MNSEQLKTWQAERMRDQLGPALRYVHRLVRRMEQRGFPPDDKLYQAAFRTYNELHTLCMKLHYLSCPSGVGMGQRE
jgi:hypothetical protein